MIALPIHGFFAFLPIAMPPTSAKMTATTEAMPTTEASTMCERGGGRERQNPGQNQTDQ